MKNLNYVSVVLIIMALCVPTASVKAQDPVQLDAKHYKVVAENNEVRVLRIKAGPGEKSVMHFHPESVVVLITDLKGDFIMEDGKTMTIDAKAGDVMLSPAGKHLPQIKNKTAEVIQIELKSNAKENRNAVKSLYDAFAIGDVPTVIAGMDANIVWNEAEGNPYADKNPYKGPNAVLEGLFSRLGGEWEYYKLADINLYEMANDFVLATGRYQAKYKKNGAVIDVQFAHLWKFKDGKVTNFQQFADTKQLSNAMSN